MNFRGYKLHVIAAACLLSVLLGLGVRHMVYSSRVAGPLERDFALIPGVARAAVQQRGRDTQIVLELEPVHDLQRLYKEADALRAARLPEGTSHLIIKDRRTEELTAVYRRIHFAVYEGAATGMFTRMAAIIDDMAAGLPADVLVSVDGRFIYVQIVSGDDYLYEIVPLARWLAGDPREGGGRL